MMQSKYLLALFTCLYLALPISTRLVRHVDHPTSRDIQTNETTLDKRVIKDGIYIPGESYYGLATSYDYNTDGKDGGSCGYTIGDQGLGIPSSILGAAQVMSRFGNGLACGTCIKVTPTDRSLVKNAEPQIVTVLNSCPGKCHSLDIESEVVTNWFGTRLGEFNMKAEVVSCDYLSRGITIQYRQITNSPYDFRLGLRLNSGAIKHAEVSLKNGGWLPLIKANPSQYTLQDNSKSRLVLSQPHFSLRFTNYVGETVVERYVPNRIGAYGFGLWYKTSVNFKHS